MRAASWFSCVLLGCALASACVLDTSLGNHRASPPAGEREDEQRAPVTSPDAGTDAAHGDPQPPIDEPGARDASSDDGDPRDSEEPSAPEPEPAGEPEPEPEPPPEPMPDMPGGGDTETPMDEMPPGEDTPPPAGACDAPTDDPCRLCDQDACCAPRRACLENDGCACHLECRRAENPEACRATCAAPGERYEPWLACVEAQCVEQCAF